MTGYTPEYLEQIQKELETICDAANRAAATIESNPAYTSRCHPFHAAAVSTYNTLVNVLLTVDRYQTTE